MVYAMVLLIFFNGNQYLRISSPERLRESVNFLQSTVTGGHVMLYPRFRSCKIAEEQFFSRVFLH